MRISRRRLLKYGGAGTVAAGLGGMLLPGAATAQPGLGAAVGTGLAGDVPSGPVVQPGSADAVAKARKLVARMTLDEKIALLHGSGGGFGNTGYAGTIAGNSRLGIPALYLADGPSGVGNGSTGVTAWPDYTTLAATFDPAAVRDFGVAYGAEQAGKGHNVALAPCINILRLPIWGRAYETFTEDPYLNGRLTAAVVRGIQTNAVIATVKHFVANNQEIRRNSIDVVVSQRALEEIYFPGFRAGVQEGGAAAIMTSYNKVNGTWTSENRMVVQETLRETWGFDGMVMSDWGGTHSTVQAAKAGSDVEMPGSTYFGDALKAAVASGAISASTVDAMAVHVLTAMYRVGLFTHRLPDPATVLGAQVSTPQHVRLARDLSIAGSVLLKNDRGTLPLHRPASLAVIGDAADTGAFTHGDGGGEINPGGPVVTPLAGIRARAGGIPVTYRRGTLGAGALPVVPASAFGAGLTARYYATTDFSGSPLATQTVPTLDWSAVPAPVAGKTDGWSVRYTGTFTAATAGKYRFSLNADTTAKLLIDGKPVVSRLDGYEEIAHGLVALTAGAHAVQVDYVGRPASPGRPPRAFLHLGYQPDYETQHREAAAAARQASVAVVVVGALSGEFYDRSTLALPGDQDELIAAVAGANPNTVVVLNTPGAVLMPWLPAVPAVLANWYGGQEQGNALAAMLFGDAEPGGRLPVTFPASDRQGPAKTTVEYPGDDVHVYYDEGLAVGYRWYLSSGERPLFPFGHGLSYTTFQLTNLRLRRTRDGVEAVVQVRNTGRRTGSEVVQAYVTAPEGSGEPSRALKAFARVELDAGQSRDVALDLPRQAFAIWLNAGAGWTVLPGTHRVAVGRSATDVPLEAPITLF